MSPANWTKITIRDLPLDLEIGVNEDEFGRRQRVLVNLEATVDITDGIPDDIDATVSYDPIVQGIRQLAAEKHVGLVETVAARIADIALREDRVLDVDVHVEKLDVYGDAIRVGARLYRRRAP